MQTIDSFLKILKETFIAITDCDDMDASFSLIKQCLIEAGLEDLFGRHNILYYDFMSIFETNLRDVAEFDNEIETMANIKRCLEISGLPQLFTVDVLSKASLSTFDKKLPITKANISSCRQYSGTPYDNKCCICHHQRVRDLYVTVCGHVTCRSCTLKWFVSHTACPMCKSEIKFSDQLYKLPLKIKSQQKIKQRTKLETLKYPAPILEKIPRFVKVMSEDRTTAIKVGMDQ